MFDNFKFFASIIRTALPITENQAIGLVFQQFVKGDSGKKVYMTDLLSANSDVSSWRSSWSMPFDGWLFLVDNNPLADWEHSCIHVLVNQDDGSTVVHNEGSPPKGVDYHEISPPPQPVA